MIDPRRLSDEVRTALRQHSQARMEGMRGERLSWWAHWADIAEMFLPRRYKWFVTPNQWNRGSQKNQSIVDETGLMASRVLASGMMSGLTDPSRKWFELGFHNLQLVEYGPVKSWLAETQRRMELVLAESNFYQAMATLHLDNVDFGSAALIIYEDFEDVIRCYNPALGEFFFGASSRLSVDTLYREFTLTIPQVVQQFTFDACSDSVKQAFSSGGSAWTREVVICHGIEPNADLHNAQNPVGSAVPSHFKFREVYWDRTSDGGNLLAVAGYHEQPFVGARWDVVSNDAYGRSPGMDALPAVRQLQIEQRRKAEGIDKSVRPPMVASANMRNEPMSTLPGGITYVTDVAASGFKPAYEVRPDLSGMVEDIKEVQDRVRQIFFNDTILMISQYEPKSGTTAAEIDARREERLMMLGPVIERFGNEVLDPVIDRVFNIMLRRGLIPPAPQEIAGQTISIQYISMLSQAQKAAKTASIERFAQFVGGIAGAVPSALDVPNWDEMLDEYADDIGTSPRSVNTPKQIALIRAQRAQEAQQQKDQQATMAAVQGAQTLSQTDVGGGKNALEQMTGG